MFTLKTDLPRMLLFVMSGTDDEIRQNDNCENHVYDSFPNSSIFSGWSPSMVTLFSCHLKQTQDDANTQSC
ncbi:uncharacterized protein EAF01_004624 [Botrytis porri]|uniref:uncharacterized protein n=1 Tax=Botrytis porri TaxID=87229 RepID=UPI0019001A3D|nr:uncharacterized protein EAF01_004624 [Botrytis porri]KAF7907037.1 hypothetical protein EAF01_004624 [Botrytis porri]